MNCRVNGIKRNLRYRILTIDDQTYVLDMGRSLWKIIFPPFFWLFSNMMYEVNDKEIIEKLKTPEIEQTKTRGDTILAGTVAIILANLLRPLGDYLHLPSNLLVNTIIVMIVILLVWSFYFYMNSRSKKSLYQVVNLEKHSKKRLWIRPQSCKHFFFILFYYLLFLGVAILGLGTFIQYPNAVALITGMFILFFSMLFSLLTVALGDNKVRFKDDKKANV